MTIRCLGTLACLFACLAAARLQAAAVEIVDGKTTLSASAGGRPVLLYRKSSPTALKPYIQELYTPGGVQVLRDSVPDHKHHHGMMFAIAAEGVNFWEEGGGAGRETSTGPMDVRPFDAAKSDAGFAGEVVWTKADGAVVLRERRAIDVYAAAEIKPTLITWRTRLQAPPGKSVKLTGSHYYGLGMRFVQPMDKTGRFFFNPDNAVGVAVGVSRVTPAKWCAFLLRGGREAGDGCRLRLPEKSPPGAILHHAAVRLHGRDDQPLEGAAGLAVGFAADLCYGVALWDGDISAGEVEKTYQQWIKLRRSFEASGSQRAGRKSPRSPPRASAIPSPDCPTAGGRPFGRRGELHPRVRHVKLKVLR